MTIVLKSEGLEKRKIWESHLSKWSISGLTQAEYCRRNSLRAGRFTYWKVKLNQEKSPVEFVQIPTQAMVQAENISAEASIPIKLHIGSRFSLDIPNGFSVETLERIFHTLRNF